MVFGRVVSGQPVVMQIEELGVDKNSRPLQDAKVVKCGELVLKSKIKRMFCTPILILKILFNQTVVTMISVTLLFACEHVAHFTFFQ